MFGGIRFVLKVGTVGAHGLVCNWEEKDDSVSDADPGGIAVVVLDGKLQSDMIFKDAGDEKVVIAMQIESSLSRRSIIRS